MSIEKLYKQFPDVHPNIVLKTDALRQGIDISDAAMENFRQRDDLLWKGFHLFSYDFKKTKVYGDKIPWVLRFEDGCPMMVRTNERSPYLLDFRDDEFVISEDGEAIARKIYFERKPRWYDMRTEDGIQMSAIAQGQTCLVFVTINKYCEFWNTGDQCLFCDINATLRDQKAGGEDVAARIDPDVVGEVVKTAVTVDHHYNQLIVSGGTILGKYKGQTELDFYITRLNAIKKKLQTWIPTCVQIAPYDDEGLKRLHDTGFSSLEPNIEVWDKKLFKWICPGKDKYIGYDEWIKRAIRAVDFWGPGMVNPNFVLGVEMAKPHGFEDVGSAVKSTAGGWDFLMSHGVLPRYNLWTREAGSAFADQESPPLQYFIEIQRAYAELRWKYKFDPPFPATHSRYQYSLNCLQDFEYYHGTGITSKQNLDARLGVKPGEKGGCEDEEGYTLSWR
ncbi:MAG: radical SAM protein [Syntrophorhabdales bacterium]|jgi:hypothetical protein